MGLGRGNNRVPSTVPGRDFFVVKGEAPRAVIEIRDLYKYYGDQRVVGPVSASIAEGEIVGLLGLNGAGKTTTLRVLACDLLPSSGTVTVAGSDVVENPDAVRAGIGYLPETPSLYGDMKVREFLTFAAKLRGYDKDVDQRVREVAKQTRISKVLDQIISTLSHGYKQRVGIAQAIVHRPSLVVLDEPITGLDPKQIVDMRALVRSLGGEHTVLVSSHILSEISETCDRLLVIRGGEIVASGTEAELSERLLEGTRVEVTVRGDGDAAEETLASVDGVTGVDRVTASEPGPDVTTFRVAARRDARSDLCKALVSADIALIELGRAERELESVFLKLADSGPDEPEPKGAPSKAKPAASSEASP